MRQLACTPRSIVPPSHFWSLGPMILTIVAACADGPTELERPPSVDPVPYLEGAALEGTASELVLIVPVDVATGTDDGPQDGSFDRLTPENLGSVNNNGFTSFRTSFEFSLGQIPPGSAVSGATLTFDISAFEGPRSIEVHGYAGDGSVALEDLARDGPLWSGTVDGSGTQSFSVDVTGTVVALVGEAHSHAGYTVREDPPNESNFTVMHMPTGRATLAVRYVSEQIVEIDVRPSDDDGPIVIRAGGHVPVAILSSTELAASDELDISSLTFGRTGDEPSLAFCNHGSDDVNLDGLADLVCHFSTAAGGFTVDDTEAILRGATWTGTRVRGSAPVEIADDGSDLATVR